MNASEWDTIYLYQDGRRAAGYKRFWSACPPHYVNLQPVAQVVLRYDNGVIHIDSDCPVKVRES